MESDLDGKLLPYPMLTGSQAVALATIAKFNPERILHVKQTWTIPGGRHTYVICNKRDYHVARNGNIAELGVNIELAPLRDKHGVILEVYNAE